MLVSTEVHINALLVHHIFNGILEGFGGARGVAIIHFSKCVHGAAATRNGAGGSMGSGGMSLEGAGGCGGGQWLTDGRPQGSKGAGGAVHWQPSSPAPAISIGHQTRH